MMSDSMLSQKNRLDREKKYGANKHVKCISVADDTANRLASNLTNIDRRDHLTHRSEDRLKDESLE